MRAPCGWRWAAHAALPLILLCTPSSAFADNTKSPAKAAKELYDQGVDLAGQQKFDLAEWKFRDAWALQQTYDIAANLGEILMQLKKPHEAAFYLGFAVNHYPASGKQEKRDWLEGRYKEAKSLVATLIIGANPAGAEVSVNKKVIGKVPLADEVYAPAGEVTIEVTAPDFLPTSQKLNIGAGKTERVQIDLLPPPRAVWPAMVVGGVGVATLVAGLGMYLVSTAKYDESRALYDGIVNDTQNSQHCRQPNPNPNCEALKSAAQTSDALFGPGVGLLIGGAVLTGLGGAYLGIALKPAGAPSPAASRGPTLNAVFVRRSGVVLQGSF
ncbi:MAG: PEGA domain-containing protein [Polyangiaceae bacterium]|nr:PEGA domain-containing protein [Polyangiaceae bacterium]